MDNKKTEMEINSEIIKLKQERKKNETINNSKAFNDAVDDDSVSWLSIFVVFIIFVLAVLALGICFEHDFEATRTIAENNNQATSATIEDSSNSQISERIDYLKPIFDYNDLKMNVYIKKEELDGSYYIFYNLYTDKSTREDWCEAKDAIIIFDLGENESPYVKKIGRSWRDRTYEFHLPAVSIESNRL